MGACQLPQNWEGPGKRTDTDHLEILTGNINTICKSGLVNRNGFCITEHGLPNTGGI